MVQFECPGVINPMVSSWRHSLFEFTLGCPFHLMQEMDFSTVIFGPAGSEMDSSTVISGLFGVHSSNGGRPGPRVLVKYAGQ